MIYVDWLQWRDLLQVYTYCIMVVVVESFLVHNCNWNSVVNKVSKTIYCRDRVNWIISSFISSIYNLQPILLCTTMVIKMETMSCHQNGCTTTIKLGWPIPLQWCKQHSAIPKSGDWNNTSKSESNDSFVSPSHNCNMYTLKQPSAIQIVSSILTPSLKKLRILNLMMHLITTLRLIARSQYQTDHFPIICLDS